MERKISAPARGAVSVVISASYLTARVITSQSARVAEAVISGSMADRVTSRTGPHGEWLLEWPEPEPVITDFVSVRGRNIAGGVRIGQVIGRGGRVIAQNVTASGGATVYQSAGNMNFHGISFGDGGVQANRFSGDDSFSTGNDPQALILTVPAGSQITAEIAAGILTAEGSVPLLAVSADFQSADLVTACPVENLAAVTMSGAVRAEGSTGNTQAKTMSGSVTLAMAGGDVRTRTVSGGIRIHATGDIAVGAKTVSGDIEVTREPGACVTASVRSVSGRVRTS